MLMLKKPYFTSLFTLTRWSVLALSAGWLSGCALSPGLSIGKGLQVSDQSVNPYSVTAKREAPGPDGKVVLGQTPPPGALLNITPELIRQQRGLQKVGLGADVKRLFGEPKAYGIGEAAIDGVDLLGSDLLALD